MSYNNADNLELEKIDYPKLSSPPTTPIPFFHFLTRLKTTKRAGWVFMGVPNAESISDHMYRMSIITLLAPPSLKSRLQLHRCTQMALLHDMAESLVGDITPREKIPKHEKHRRESSTMDWLTESLLGASANGLKESGEELRALWQEYEDDKTEEARFVHDVDKFELMLQMVEYEKQEKKQIDLGEFCGVLKSVTTKEVLEWSLEVLQGRKIFWGDQYSSLNGAEYEELLRKKLEAQGGSQERN